MGTHHNNHKTDDLRLTVTFLVITLFFTLLEANRRPSFFFFYVRKALLHARKANVAKVTAFTVLMRNSDKDVGLLMRFSCVRIAFPRQKSTV